MPTTREILRKFENLQTLPHVAIRLNKLLSDDSSSMQDFEEIINMDPSLVLRLLRVVNSAYYGMAQKVDNISRAVMIVGMKNLRNMVVASALKDIFTKDADEDIISRPQLWLHSVAVSICSKMISERIFGRIGEDVFLCGLVHDIGFIIEDQVVHDLILEVCKTYTPDAGPITKYEREVIGTDHCELGYVMAREWKLPQHVLDGIKYHHDVNKEISPSSEPGIIQMADFLVSELNYPAFKNISATLSPDLSDYIDQNSDEFEVLISDLPDEISKAEELFSSDSD